MRATFQKIGVKLRAAFDVRDRFVFGGLLLVAIGLWQWQPPLAFVVTGAALFWLGLRRP